MELAGASGQRWLKIAADKPGDKLLLAWLLLLSFASYWPALDNFFISDDFVFLSQARIADRDPSHVLDFPPGFYRLTSYLYWWLGYKLFGLRPEPFYLLAIALHGAIAYLVFRVILHLAADRATAALAAIFFALYERHNEAVMWINSAHELLQAAAVLLCLLAWGRYRSQGGGIRDYIAAMAWFVAALLSKESAVVLLPLMLLLEWGREGRIASWRPYLAFALLVAIYGAAFYLLRNEHPLVRYGYYGVSGHFILVYAKSLNRLLLFIYPFALYLIWAGRRAGKTVKVPKEAVALAGWLLISILPYSFLLYLDHIPSRHTYLPSIAAAGLFAQAALAARQRARASAVVSGAVLLLFAWNVAYIWIKDKQYEERARPTRALIKALDERARLAGGEGRIYIKGFELPAIYAAAATELFTTVDPKRIVLVETSNQVELEPGALFIELERD